MAIAVRDSDSGSQTASTSITANWTGLQENDFVGILLNALNNSAEWTVPTNWNGFELASSWMNGLFCWRYVPPGGMTSQAFSFGASATLGQVSIALSGVNTTYPFTGCNVKITEHAATAAKNPPGLSLANSSWSVLFASVDNQPYQGGNSDQPTGYTEQEVIDANGMNLMIAYKALGTTVPLASTPGDWTLQSADEYCTINLIVPPSGQTIGG